MELGSLAPTFSLPGTQGQFALEDALTKGPVVLMFYPKDNTPG